MKKEPNTTIGEEHPKREVEVLVSLKQSEDDGESSETWDDKVLRVPVDLSVCSFSQRILSAFWQRIDVSRCKFIAILKWYNKFNRHVTLDTNATDFLEDGATFNIRQLGADEARAKNSMALFPVGEIRNTSSSGEGANTNRPRVQLDLIASGPVRNSLRPPSELRLPSDSNDNSKESADRFFSTINENHPNQIPARPARDFFSMPSNSSSSFVSHYSNTRINHPLNIDNAPKSSNFTSSPVMTPFTHPPPSYNPSIGFQSAHKRGNSWKLPPFVPSTAYAPNSFASFPETPLQREFHNKIHTPPRPIHYYNNNRNGNNHHHPTFYPIRAYSPQRSRSRSRSRSHGDHERRSRSASQSRSERKQHRPSKERKQYNRQYDAKRKSSDRKIETDRKSEDMDISPEPTKHETLKEKSIEPASKAKRMKVAIKHETTSNIQISKESVSNNSGGKRNETRIKDEPNESATMAKDVPGEKAPPEEDGRLIIAENEEDEGGMKLSHIPTNNL